MVSVAIEAIVLILSALPRQGGGESYVGDLVESPTSTEGPK